MTMMPKNEASVSNTKGQTSCAGAFCVASLMASLAAEHSDVLTPERKNRKMANDGDYEDDVCSDAETESGSLPESSSCRLSTNGSAIGDACTASTGSPYMGPESGGLSDSDDEVNLGEWMTLGGRLDAAFARVYEEEAKGTGGQQIDLQGWSKVSTAFVQAIDDAECKTLDEHLDLYLDDEDDMPDADDLDDRLAFPVLLRGKRKYSPGGQTLAADIDAWRAVGVKVHHGLSEADGEDLENWHHLGTKVSQRMSAALANISCDDDTDDEWK